MRPRVMYRNRVLGLQGTVKTVGGTSETSKEQFHTARSVRQLIGSLGAWRRWRYRLVFAGQADSARQ